MKKTKKFFFTTATAVLLLASSLPGCTPSSQTESTSETPGIDTIANSSYNPEALTFCASYKVNNLSANSIDFVAYYYEPITGVMYTALNGSREKIAPMPKADGTYLTHEEWLKHLDDAKC